MKSLVIIFIAILGLTGTLTAQEKTVKGVVTYFFNDYQGDKPDIGAKVHAIDSINFHAQYLVIDSFKKASIYQSLLKSSEEIAAGYKKMSDQLKGKKKRIDDYNNYTKRYEDANADIIEYKGKLLNLNIFSVKDFEALDERTSAALSYLKLSAQSTTVDGSGNYSLSLQPGVYYIIITSNNRKRLTISEVLGQFEVKKVNLLNSNFEFSNKFSL